MTHDPGSPGLNRPDMTAHGQDDERNGEYSCDDDTTTQCRECCLTARLAIVLGVSGFADGLGGVACPCDSLDNSGVAERAGQRGDTGTMGRQIDLCQRDAGNIKQRLLDARNTSTAGHAFDGVVALHRRRLIAQALDRSTQGRGVGQDFSRYRGTVGGKIDLGLVDACDLGQRAFDLCDAAAAGHAFYREIKVLGHRYFKTSMSSATIASSSPRLAAVTT